MKKKTKQIFFIFVLIILISLFFDEFVGKFIYFYIMPTGGLGPGGKCPECFDGFILTYLFLISLLFNIIRVDKRYWVLLLPLVFFLNPPYEFLIISLSLIFLAWILAKGVLVIRKNKK